MVDRIRTADNCNQCDKLRPELLEEAMRFIDYLIHREKEKQSVPGISDTNEIEILPND